jgi:hypothetical protein
MIENYAHAAALAMRSKVESLCGQARDRGPGWRLAVGSVHLQNSVMGYQLVYDVQFLRPGALPGGVGDWTIYGPWNDGWTQHNGSAVSPAPADSTVDAQGDDGEMVQGWWPHNVQWAHVRWWRVAS